MRTRKESEARPLFGSPDLLDVLDPSFGFVGTERGAELEDFDMARCYERFEGSKIHHARAGRTMVTPGKLDVVDMEANQTVAQGFKVQGMMNETEVLFDLRVAGIMPITERGIWQVAKEELVVAFQR